MADTREKLNQRLWDLVRQQRMELLGADLITQDEYALLAFDHAAVARLVDYDGVRAQLATEKQRADTLEARMKATLDHFDNAFGLQMLSTLEMVERDHKLKMENRRLAAELDAACQPKEPEAL